jgi:bifunctional polynucleotide phosphatase/kinase
METKTKVIFTDLDSTIITTKSGATFPKGIRDWKLIPSTAKLLKEYSNSGYKIVLVTNQAGISRGYVTKSSFAKKVLDVQVKLGLFFDKIFIAASLNSKYRKPKSKDLKKDLEEMSWDIDWENSLMIGDAGGRVKDFSNTDLLFAKSLGIKFVHVDDI